MMTMRVLFQLAFLGVLVVGLYTLVRWLFRGDGGKLGDEWENY